MTTEGLARKGFVKIKYAKLSFGSEFRDIVVAEKTDLFDDYMWEVGSNDLDYEKYKREHNMVELTDFNSETTDEIVLIVDPLLAPFVFRLDEVSVNVIVGATLSVILTVKFVCAGVPNELLAVTLPTN